MAALRRRNVGLAKRVIQWIVLGILVQVGLFAQNTQVRVGLSMEGPIFLVDGQPFTAPQVFFWPVGSTHTVQFLHSQADDGSSLPYQIDPSRQIRWSLNNGWGANLDAPNLNDNPLVAAPDSRTFRVTPTLTDVSGSVDKFFLVLVRFGTPYPPGNPYPTNDTCGDMLVSISDPRRQGFILIDGGCYQTNADLWLTPGTHDIRGFGYIGYAYNGSNVGFQSEIKPTDATFEAKFQGVLLPQFILSKRINFRTDTAGMQILVDRAPITPTPVDPNISAEFPNQNAACTPTGAALPVSAPAGTPPYCNGDFDFLPGSQHQIGAAAWQTDIAGRRYVIDSFSNGTPINGILIAGTDTSKIDTVTAHFVDGLVANFVTIPGGMSLGFDGQTATSTNTFGLTPGSGTFNWTSNSYGFIWGRGHTHTISAPAVQTDAQGRKWKFVKWSDGGNPTHDVIIQGDIATGFTDTAYFVELGQVQVTSTPPGMTVKVNGANCVTPCTYDTDPGSKLQLSAPKQVLLGATARRDLSSWSGSPSGVSDVSVTVNDNVQVINASYLTSYLFQADTDPGGAATFNFNPTSPDGFFLEGTPVQVTISPNKGFKFLRWAGDLSGTLSPGRLTADAPHAIVAVMSKVAIINPAGIQTAAGDNADHAVSPGSIMTIYGDGLSDVTAVGPSNPLAQTVGDVYVTIGDQILPLIFVSPQQINAQVPSNLGDGTYTVVVHATGKPDVSGTMKVQRDAPGVFVNYSGDGKPFIAALHQDGTGISPSSPVIRGETITLFATGLGPYNHSVPDGFPIPAQPTFGVLDSVSVYIGQPPTAADPTAANPTTADPTAATPPAPTDQATAPAVDDSTAQTAAVQPAATTPAPVLRQPTFVGGIAGMTGISMVQVKIDSALPTGNLLDLYLSVGSNGAQSNHVPLPVQ
ncbi:MAG: IPT/TIG domain-containing protein [Acidobacteriota bacterium]